MNNSRPNNDAPGLSELSGALREAVEQIHREPISTAALDRALLRALQLDTPAVSAECERQEILRADLGKGVRSLLPERPAGCFAQKAPDTFSKRFRFFHSSGRMMMITRIAAALLAVVGITGLAAWLAPGGGAAFAQVQEALDKVRFVTFDATSRLPGQEEIKSHALVRGSNMRVELPGGDYLVFDSSAAKMLQVKQQEKRAVVMTNLPVKGEQAMTNIYETLRTMHARAVKQLPAKKIDGIDAQGLLITDDHKTMRVWINPATNLPLRVESTYRRPDGSEFTETASNFVYDKPLDESLFSTDPPADYTVETREFPKPAEGAHGDLIVTPRVGLGPAAFGMTKDELIRSFGRPDDTQTSQVGETLRYDTQGFWLSLGSDGKLRQIQCHAHPDAAAPVACTFAGKTDQGIAMGASRHDISKAYGPPNSQHENEGRFGKLTSMDYWDLGLTFSLRNDALEEISLSAPKPLEN